MGATDTPESLTGRVNATFRRRLQTTMSTAMMESHNAALLKRKIQRKPLKIQPYPALSGRQECCGLRQSIPSRRQANCAAVSDTMPSFAEGQMKRPFSSRLA